MNEQENKNNIEENPSIPKLTLEKCQRILHSIQNPNGLIGNSKNECTASFTSPIKTKVDFDYDIPNDFIEATMDFKIGRVVDLDSVIKV